MEKMLAILFLSCVGSVVSQSTVETQFGSIIGTLSSQPPFRQFLGIPFAEPPLGNLRFANPIDWNTTYVGGVFNATQVSPSCAGVNASLFSVSEDCLHLNVYTPLNANATSLYPVMVWIYGGGFTGGTITGYTGEGFASKDGVIFVAMNYRLQSFGWLPFQEAVNAGESTGNYGLLDQQSALRWVKANIRAFGGDPNQVTLFGESAGAISTMIHTLVSPGLFQAAISESGYPTARFLPERLNLTTYLATQLSCSNSSAYRACLRNKTTAEIIAAQGDLSSPFFSIGFGPVIDGVLLKRHPWLLLPQIAQIPLLAGSNHDEGTYFIIPGFPNGMNSTEYLGIVSFLLAAAGADQPRYYDAALLLYPSSSNGLTNVLTASALLGDATFGCQTRLFLRGTTPFTQQPAFKYRFDHTPCDPIPFFGVYHSAELYFVFDTPLAPCSVSSTDLAFSHTMATYWTNFAASHNPNYRKVPGDSSLYSWPTYNATNDLELILNDTFTTAVNQRSQYCDFWDSVILNTSPPTVSSSTGTTVSSSTGSTGTSGASRLSSSLVSAVLLLLVLWAI